MRLSELSKQHMIIIYTLAFLISIGLLYKFVVSSELGRYRAAVGRYNSQQQREMRQVTRRNSLVEHYMALKEDADKTQKLLFTEREAEDFFLKVLPGLSSEMGNKLLSMVPQKSKSLTPKRPNNPKKEKEEGEANSPVADVEEKPVPVTLTGEYGNMIELFRALEGNKKLMAISNVGVTAAGKGEEVSVRFNLNLIHAGLDAEAPPEDVMSEIVANYHAAQMSKFAEAAVESAEPVAAESTDGEPKPRRRWISLVLDKILRRKPKAKMEPEKQLAQATPEQGESIEPKQSEDIEPEQSEDSKPEQTEASKELVEATPGQRKDPKPRERDSEPVKSEPEKKVTKRYSVQVGVFEIESNVKELGGLLESKNLDPWIKPGLKTMTPPYYVFVGRFDKKTDAYKFGKVLMDELPWITEYTVKEVLLDYDAVVRETRSLN